MVRAGLLDCKEHEKNSVVQKKDQKNYINAISIVH